MLDQYSINTKAITIEDYRQILQNKELLPGRIILYEALDERFDLLKKQNISSLYDLIQSLSTKNKVAQMAQKTKLPLDYLTILRREARAMLSKPVMLNTLPAIDPKYIEHLAELKINNSKQLIKKAKTPTMRHQLSVETSLPVGTIENLACLSDLLRINGVGTVFSRILYDADVCCVEALLKQTPDKTYKQVIQSNFQKYYDKAHLTIKDINYCLSFAQYLPIILTF